MDAAGSTPRDREKKGERPHMDFGYMSAHFVGGLPDSRMFSSIVGAKGECIVAISSAEGRPTTSQIFSSWLSVDEL